MQIVFLDEPGATPTALPLSLNFNGQHFMNSNQHFVFQEGKTYDLLLINPLPVHHPFHIHRFTFQPI
jgi:FtsP/CotA-like multicopper oxidase with cupredoxin domain